jgi:hypothetical protein
MTVVPYPVKLSCPYGTYDSPVPFSTIVQYDPKDKKDFQNRQPLTDHMDLNHALQESVTLSFTAPRSTPPTKKDSGGHIIEFHPNPEWWIDLKPLIAQGKIPGIPSTSGIDALFIKKMTFRASINVQLPAPDFIHFGSFLSGELGVGPITPTEAPFVGSIYYFVAYVTNPVTYAFTDDFYAYGVLEGIFDLAGINLVARFLGMTSLGAQFPYIDYDTIEIDMDYSEVV